MKTSKITLSLFFPLYLLSIILGGYTLTGFWSDVVLVGILTLATPFFKLKDKYKTLNYTNHLCVIVSYLIGILYFILPFSWNIYNLHTFNNITAQGKTFHAYFEPVGAGRAGSGNLWITQSPNYLPFVEHQIFRQTGIHEDMSSDTWEDGTPTIQVLKKYYIEKIIN